MKIFGGVISTVVASVILIRSNETSTKILIYCTGWFSMTAGGRLCVETASVTICYIRIFRMVLGRWKPMTARKMAGMFGMVLFMMWTSFYRYRNLYNTDRCTIDEDLVVGEISWKIGGEEKEPNCVVHSGEYLNHLFDVMTEHFMRPVVASLGDNPCIGSVVVADIKACTFIPDDINRRVIISVHDFLQTNVSERMARYNLHFGLMNIMKGAELVESNYFFRNQLKKSLLFPGVGLCLFIIGDVLKRFVNRLSATPDDGGCGMGWTAFAKYLPIYLAITCVVVLATMFVVYMLNVSENERIAKFWKEKRLRLLQGARKRDVGDFIDHVVKQVMKYAPGWIYENVPRNEEEDVGACGSEYNI